MDLRQKIENEGGEIYKSRNSIYGFEPKRHLPFCPIYKSRNSIYGFEQRLHPRWLAGSTKVEILYMDLRVDLASLSQKDTNNS